MDTSIRNLQSQGENADATAKAVLRDPIAVVLFGAPGSGKGTQARRIGLYYGLPQISPGEIFRTAVKERTPLGLKVEKIMQRGELVSDDVVCNMMEERLKQFDCDRGFILDGFPRSVAQAIWLDGFLLARFLPTKLRNFPPIVVHLQMEESRLLLRLAGRRVCPACGATYNVSSGPPTAKEVCEQDGYRLVSREDDNLDSLRERLAAYNRQSLPVISYYRNRNRVISLPGEGSPEEICNSMLAEIESQAALL